MCEPGTVSGVIGASASPGGAGIGAANTGSGPDLVLDGSADDTDRRARIFWIPGMRISYLPVSGIESIVRVWR